MPGNARLGFQAWRGSSALEKCRVITAFLMANWLLIKMLDGFAKEDNVIRHYREKG